MTNNDKFFMALEEMGEARRQLESLAEAAFTMGFRDLSGNLKAIEMTIGSRMIDMRRAFAAEVNGERS